MINFTIDVDADGIALVTFDVPGQRMNTLSSSTSAELRLVLERIVSDDAIKGVILTSGKETGFCAGADLGELGHHAGQTIPEDHLQAGFEALYAINQTPRALETCGKPIAAALNGLALGGGLELALACHYRVAADLPKAVYGLPEATVGLLPGGGGTQRLARLLGAEKALPLLLEGRTVGPAEALKLGLVHEVIPVEEVVAAARRWLLTIGDPVQPWDRKGFQIPGGAPHGEAANAFVNGNAALRKRTFGNYPAQINILKCVYEGLQVPIETALRIETRYFLATLATPEAAALVRTGFQSAQALSKGAGRPEGFARFDVRKAAVLGAGMMGAGIAHVQALAGIETVLIDTMQEAADKGRAYSAGLLDKAVAKGAMTREAADIVLARITATTDFAAIAGSDIVIEAVFEDRAIKADVTRRAEAWLGEAAVFGSNTSTLPITGLAEASVRPANFVGLHFFSPVDRMALVEIIVGEKTSDETLAKAIDYVLKIRKTPIVVGDARGFYTSRVFGTYISEGLELLCDGVPPAVIDNVGRGLSMPRGPLELSDDVAIDLLHKVRVETAKELGEAYEPGRTDALLATLVADLGRYGRKNRKGFYDYPQEGGRKRLWSGLGDHVATNAPLADLSIEAARREVKTRLLYRQAVETARCFEEGVLADPRDADVGAVLGWGFATWTGGPISLIDRIGAASFVAECDALADRLGERFRPPQLLRDMAASGESFYGRADARRQAA